MGERPVVTGKGIRRLRKEDDCSSFFSGAEDLDDWLARFAWENLQAGNAITYVAVNENQAIVGYYALAAASYGSTALPVRLAKNRPERTPCILLARLAVARDEQGKGLGRALLADALLRSARISQELGAAALLVHARDAAAREFYLANGDFLPSPVEPRHLFVPTKRLRQLLADAEAR
ncbi:MAG: GNAT family N-acetyltransferase [Propionibacteriaceae bacterium]|nr:GNAT family N-acetyltransferase [Propionibacteriaceae bacterium]